MLLNNEANRKTDIRKISPTGTSRSTEEMILKEKKCRQEDVEQIKLLVEQYQGEKISEDRGKLCNKVYE